MFRVRTNSLTLVSLSPLLLAVAVVASDTQPQWSRETVAGGTRFETSVIIRRADAPGPVVMVVGGIHGNEPAGALAAEQVAAWPIQKGMLVIVPRANPPALAAGQRYTPKTDAALRNLNRNFPSVDGVVVPTGQMAPRLWALVERFRPDWLVDLHEGREFHRSDSTSVGSSVIHDNSPEAARLAKELLQRVNRDVEDAQRRFVELGPPVAGSLARAVAKHTPGRVMILETTTKAQPLPLRARQHRTMVACLLHALGMLPEGITENSLVALRAAGPRRKIAIYDDGGVAREGIRDVRGIWSRRLEAELHLVCGADVRAGVLGPFDVVCFGGSGSGQAASLREEGRRAVRQFCRDGGTYVGICAGAYLGCSGFPWDLDLLDARTKSDLWRRGRGSVTVELTAAGQASFGADRTRWTMIYANGPILAPNDLPELDDFQVLAWFRTEISENGTPVGIMKDSPAIVSGRFDKGRVVCYSSHPEKTADTTLFVDRILDW